MSSKYTTSLKYFDKLFKGKNNFTMDLDEKI